MAEEADVLVPASVTGVIVFLLCVAPGTCYELLRNRTLHPREESAFLQISRVLFLSGTLFTAAGLGLLVLIHLLAPASLIDPPALLTGGTAYMAGHLGQVGLTLLLQLIFASLIAVMINDLRTPPDASVITQGTLWHTASERLRRPGLRTYLSVRLKSGGDVLGYYVGSSTDLEPAKREIMVGAPLEYTATQRQSRPSHWRPVGAPWSLPEVRSSTSLCPMWASR